MRGRWWSPPDLILDNKAPVFGLALFIWGPGLPLLVISWLS